MPRQTIKRIPAPAQDILTVLDVILQVINVIEALYRMISTVFTPAG